MEQREKGRKGIRKKRWEEEDECRKNNGRKKGERRELGMFRRLM